MMKEWRNLKLGDIAVISYGYTAKASVENVGSNFLRITDIQNDMVNWSSVPYCQITEDDFKKYKLIDQDIVFARTGATTGKSYLVCDPPEAVAASYLIRLRVQEPTVSAKFISKYFQSSEYWDNVSSGISGSAQGGFNASKLSALAIPIPPLSEQKRIVLILDEAFEGIDRAIANTEKNLANSRELFESYLNAIFTQKGDRWEEARPKLIPLSTLLSKQPRNGWSPPARFQTGSGVPVLTLSAVTGFHYDGSRIKLTIAPTSEEAYYWLQEGELLISRSNTRELVGHVAIYDGNPPKAICPDLIMKMTVDHTKADTRFIYYFLRSATARKYLTGKAKGASSTMPKITKQVVQETPIPTFNLTEQQAIVKKIDEIVTETQRLEAIYRQKLAALKELKQTILQKAFTGELTADTANHTTKAAQRVNAA